MKTNANKTLLLVLALAVLTLNLLVSHPAKGAIFIPIGGMKYARYSHTATLLPNGKVLIAGGIGVGGVLSSAELYDPNSGTWTTTVSMTNSRAGHTATLLPNGKVLVTGGWGNGGVNASAELFDPATGTWALTKTGMSTARAYHTATLLPNGQVLVVGGTPDGNGLIKTSELYDPNADTWTLTGSLNTARNLQTATLMGNGQVMVAGGYYDYLSSAELFTKGGTPATGEWTNTAAMNIRRSNNTMTLLPNGWVLIAGGKNGSDGYGEFSDSELYIPTIGIWTNADALHTARAYHTATLLSDGNVMVTGGVSVSGSLLSSTEIYWTDIISYPENPIQWFWVQTSSLNAARSSHTATLLPSGKVLIAGGYGDNGALSSAELFDPLLSPATWTITLTDVNIMTNGSFRLEFTNAHGALFSVLATTNLMLPLTNWTMIGIVTDSPPGQFQFTDQQATTNSQRFYRIRSP